MDKSFTNNSIITNKILDRLVSLKQNLMAHRGDPKNDQKVAEKLYYTPSDVDKHDETVFATFLIDVLNQNMVDASFEEESVENGICDPFNQEHSFDRNELKHLANQGGWLAIQKDGSLGRADTDALLSVINQGLKLSESEMPEED